LILSDTLYWYTPTITRNKTTGKTETRKQKFDADKLQRSYSYFKKLFGFSKVQIKRAIDRLVDQNLMTREFRTIERGELKIGNVMFLDLNVKNIELITTNILDNPYLLWSKQGVTTKSIGDNHRVMTNTYTSTETSTIPSKDGISASTSRSRDSDNDFGYQDSNTIDSQDNTLDSQQEFDGQKSTSSKPDKLRRMAREKSNEKKPEKPDYECPKINLNLVEYWLSVTGKFYRKRNTKTFENDCKNIGKLRRGTFFSENNTPSVPKKYYGRKFSNAEIQLAMDRFSIMRNNADFFPKNKTNIKRISITPFLYNTVTNGDKKSYFITCFENEPQRIKPELKDTNPDLTDLIVRTAKKRYNWDLSNGDHEIAIKCSRKLTEFFESNKSKMPLYKIHYVYNNQKVDAIFDMLEYNEDYNRQPKPIYLSSDLTFSKIFPDYMRYVGSLD
jgi:hypothetical protein